MNLKKHILLITILILGAFFRFYNINWDSGFHLHPDERFLTMVGNSMTIPNSLSDYLDPKTSTLNPSNIGYKFFVYGIFPVTINKLVAIILNNDTYNDFTIQGRFLSALFDLLIIILIYKTVFLLEKKYNLHLSIKYWASFFYAIAVLPIQLSHFFVVDTFLNFFMFTSFYFILNFSLTKKIIYIFLSGVLLGLGLATKLSAIYILALNLGVLYSSFLLNKNILQEKLKTFINLSLVSYLYALTIYFAMRLADPYIFESNNIFDLHINSSFFTSLKTLTELEQPNTWFPPAIQWLNKSPVLFSLQNLIVFGIGIPCLLFLLLGFKECTVMYVKKIKKIKLLLSHTELLLIIVWVLLFFLYQSTNFVKIMRYFIFLYPFLSIISAIGFSSFIQKRRAIVIITSVLLIMTWPLQFLSIYIYPHSRIKASEWIYANIPNNSILVNEHWDDPLPLSTNNLYGKRFNTELLPVFDRDTKIKWQKINELLKKGDYLVLSSNRGWESIPAVPKKYPLMSKFYKDLFEGKLAYKKIKEFTSYPSLKYLGIPINLPDDWADESFTVYDHPQVIIFKHEKRQDQ